MMASTETTLNSSVTMTASAAGRIAVLAAKELKPSAVLRLAVDGGGCSGFSYAYSFEDQALEDDLVVERDGATLVIDPTSLEFLAGAEIDFVQNLLGASFQINNPNASSSCGCGTSFSI